jgi:hypothetical protein
MDKAKISLTVECAPEMAARLPQVVALVELLLNGRIETRELPSALLAMLLETSRLIEAGTPAADDGQIWELVETACDVVAEQVRGALSGPAPAAPALIKLNGAHKNGYGQYEGMQLIEELG